MRGGPPSSRVRVWLAATSVAAAAASCGCSSQGSAASPTWQAVAEYDATAADASVEAGPSYTVCATDLDASFSSLLANVFDTPSCGTNRTNNCHSFAGSRGTGGGSLLSFEGDAGDVYAELVGPDGGLIRSTDVDYFSANIPRVVPGDAGASMLYVKLTLDAGNVMPYGGGMPQQNPGSVCPAVLDAVRTWIDQGAKPN
jgi:hypothetical protein